MTTRFLVWLLDTITMFEVWPQNNSAFRIARGFKYLCFAIAAMVSAFAPSNIIFGIFSRIPAFSYVWSVIFFIGAILCLYGIVRKKWTGEYVGLPGVVTCLLLYSIGCFVDVGEITPQRVFLGFVFLAFTASSFARRQDVKFQKLIADFEQRAKDGKRGI